LQQAGFTQEQINTGGWTIKLTMDPNVQKSAKANLNANVAPTAYGLANAMAIIKPGTTSHDVLAMVSNRGYGLDTAQGQVSTNQVSLPSVSFGAGSIFKTFTAASALEQGKAGINTQLPNPMSNCFSYAGSTKCYLVNNLGATPDPITMQEALSKSPNVAFVGLLLQDGIPNAVDMAYRLGLRNTMQTINEVGSPQTTTVKQQMLTTEANNPSFTLGTTPVSPLELANVSATLNSGGTWCPPNPIAEITDRNGNAITVPRQACEQAVDAGTANTLLNGMSDDTITGTSATAAKSIGWTRPTAGKTGTTNLNESVGFLGAVPGYSIASLTFADGRSPAAICANPTRMMTAAAPCKGTFGGEAATPPALRTLNDILGTSAAQALPAADPSYLDANSHGPTVPFLFQKDVVSATKTLQDAGYQVVTKDVASTRSAGMVISQSIYGVAPTGTTLTIYVSTGQKPTVSVS
jgi:membrane peptidoglycan carboxypeptidase